MKKIVHKSRSLGMTTKIAEMINQEFPADSNVTFIPTNEGNPLKGQTYRQEYPLPIEPSYAMTEEQAEKILTEMLVAHPNRYPSWNQKRGMVQAIMWGEYGKALDILCNHRKPFD